MKEFCIRIQCPPGEYLCRTVNYCITVDLFCDGIKHCYQGDDEVNCGQVFNRNKFNFWLNIIFFQNLLRPRKNSFKRFL